MKKLKKLISSLLCLMLIVSLVCPMGVHAAGTEGEVPEKSEVSNKSVEIKFMTDGTTVVGKSYVTVAEGEEVTLTAEKLSVLAPEGYELLDKNQSVKVKFDTKEVRVLVSKVEEPAPENKNVPVKFMTDGTTVVDTRYVTVAEGEEVTLTAEELSVLAPKGYELLDKNQSVKVTFNTKEVRVLVSKVEEPAPENKNVPVKFMTDGTTVVDTRYVTVAEGEELTLTAEALSVLAPEGYELLDKNQSVKVTFNTKEVRVLVSKIEQPAPENKNVPVKFMTDGTTVVDTRYVTVAEGEELTLTAEALSVLAPEGYELVDKEQSVKVTFNTKEVRVLVSKVEEPAPENKNVPIKFMTDGTTVVDTRYVTVAEGEELTLTAEALSVLAPEGYELSDKNQSVKVTFNTKEVRVLVSKIEQPAPENKNVPIKFMIDGTTIVGTGHVTVAEGEELTLTAEALSVLAPEGYELVDKEQSVKVTFNTKEVRVLVSAIEKPLPEVKEVPVKFMTDGTTVVGTATILVEEGSTVEVDAFKLGAMAPEGYELADKEQSVKVTFNTKEVRVLVNKVEQPAPENKNVPIKFMIDGTTVVDTRYVTVAEGEELTLTAEALSVLAPEGYELVDKEQSVKVTFNTKEVRVLVSAIEKPLPEVKEVPVKFMTDGTTVVGTATILVEEGSTVEVDAFKLGVMAPEGYELVDKEQSVKVTFDTKEVRVLVAKIEQPEINDPETNDPTKPTDKPNTTDKPNKTDKTDKTQDNKKETKDETVKTGDTSNVMLWFSLFGISMVCAVVVLGHKKKDAFRK